MAAYRVGLTGGLASGKSTIAHRLAAAGFRVVEADQLVAELYAPDGPGARAVAALFGSGYLRPDGAVDKPKLARLVFADVAARRRLEAAVHPLVRARFDEIAAASDGVVVLEAALLAEAGHTAELDLVVTVEAEPETRLRRAVARGLSEDDARARLAAQGDGSRRRAIAHRTIVNDGSLADLEREIVRLIAELRAAAGASAPPP